MLYEKISGFSDEIAPEISTQFEVLNKLNIKYFEPRGVDGKNISELSDDEVAELKNKMEQYNISVSSIGSPVGKIKLSADFDKHFELYKRIVKIAKTLGTKYIRIFSFYHESDTEWTAEERTEVLRRLKLFIDYAKQEDIVLLHENEKDIYGDIVERCVDLMNELACDNFAAVFDPANFVQCGEDTKLAFEMLGANIKYIHIKDALYEDGSTVPAGAGDGNVEYILTTLIENGYTGFLSLEPHIGNFKGFEALELTNAVNKLPDGGEGTFTAAYLALEKILKNI